MSERPTVSKGSSKIFDAHKAWLCCLIALGVELAFYSFRLVKRRIVCAASQ
jgi:hypothetical protein